jgi:probable HAF family extracellular repeat protein
MQRFTTRLALAALVAVALSSPRLAAAGGYTITDLGTLPGSASTWDWQQSINNDGVVAAYANNTADPNAFAGDSSFLWKNGKITHLPGLFGATDTVAFSLNNEGQVVGRSTPAGEKNHAVLWDHGVIQKLGELPGQPGHGHNSSAAVKINDRGQAVGYSRNTVDFPNTRQAVLWYKGTIAQLPPLPNGGNLDEGLGINEEGQIVGFSGPAGGPEHPALWAEGAEGNPIDLDQRPGPGCWFLRFQFELHRLHHPRFFVGERRDD